MNNFVKINTQEVDKILANLSNQETVKDILNEGIEAMSNVYYDSILSSLKKEMGSVADTPGINKKYNYTLASGIKKRPDKANVMFGIHGLTDFRLIFFEGGTRQRFTKGHKITGYINSRKLKRSGKGGYRGFITPNNFFTKGINNAETNAFNILVETINKAIKNRGIEI
ncbi:hypothetical protein [Prevotella koreensis]